MSFFTWVYPGLELALAGQKTEHQFANLQCGIMDQFASLHGKAGHLMKLDCRNLEYEYIPFDFPDIRIILVNSMVSHSLASSEYNLRRQQCDAGVAVLRNYDSNIHSLRDVGTELIGNPSQGARRYRLQEVPFYCWRKPTIAGWL